MNTNNKIGKTLKAYRLDRLWTLAQMAAMSGLSTSAIEKLENNKCKPSDLSLAKLRRAFPDLEIAT